jgi:hypothetical protein
MVFPFERSRDLITITASVWDLEPVDSGESSAV